ncbi:MAG: hypothetical protein HY748_18700 [Elusimicrobia bacterium]|nr:hypothetical protein [Elusimicrobiota bacterium]
MRTTEKLAGKAALAVFAGTIVAALAVRCLPIAAFPFDWEPTDGDVLSQVNRLIKGLPLYTDWPAGDILLPYPPLYYGLVAAGAKLGADPVLFGRGVNLVMLVVVFLLGMLALSEPRGRGFRPSWAALLFPAMFALNWRSLEEAVYLRADALLLILQAALAALLVCAPHRTVALGALAGLIPFAKQFGVGASLGAALCLADLARRARRGAAGLPAFLLASAGCALAVIMLFEALNHGRFLRVALFHPARVFAGDMLSWGQLWHIMREYYWTKPWVIALAAVGIAAHRGGRLRPLLFLLAADGAVSFLAARNIGGTYAYLWFHWFLVCVFAALGVEAAAGRLAALSPDRHRGRAFAAALAAVLLCCVPYEAEVLSFRLRSTAGLWRAAAAHQGLIGRLVREYPGAKWIATRHATALGREGVVLDQDWCTMELAFAGPARFDPAPLARRLARGEYRFAQVAESQCGFDQPLTPVLKDCFSPIARSSVVSLGSVYPALILRYDPSMNACKEDR